MSAIRTTPLQPTNGNRFVVSFCLHRSPTNSQMTPSFIGVLTSALSGTGVPPQVMSRVVRQHRAFPGAGPTRRTGIMSTNQISVTGWEPPYVSVPQQLAYSTNVNLAFAGGSGTGLRGRGNGGHCHEFR